MDTVAENIIHTSHQKFKNFGIRSISVDDICNELHISKKTFYSRFPQKECLIEAVLDYESQVSTDNFEKTYKNKNAIDALIIIIKDLKNSIDKAPLTFHYDLEKYYPATFTKYKERQSSRIRNCFEINLRKGIEEGYYREDIDVELVSLFHSIQIRQTFEQMQKASPKITKKQLVDFFIDLIVRLITNENGYKYMNENYYKLKD